MTRLTSEGDLFEKMLNGNHKALKQLLENYHNYLTVVAYRYLRDESRCQDIIHDVFVSLWDSGKKINLTSGPKSYLRGAVIKSCLAAHRKESRTEYVENHNEDASNSYPTPEDIYGADELQQRINTIITSLPSKCQTVFKLSRVEGKSHKEIAKLLGISTKTIENHMTKALKALRDGLRKDEFITIILGICQVGEWIW